jgi:hypothetical protein
MMWRKSGETRFGFCTDAIFTDGSVIATPSRHERTTDLAVCSNWKLMNSQETNG